jgi:NAD(P)-dependent dehydrogenase (short-subunit alcohol dehydrogenase family)
MTDERIALVTGANKGIGHEVARQLAARGCRVWIGARDAGRGEAAAEALRAQGGEARFVALDVTDADSIRRAAATIGARRGGLDILVNNAGIVLDGGAPPSGLDVGLMEATYATNVFGPVRVTQAMLPLLRRSPFGRIVMVSSGLGSLAQMSDPRYEFAAYNLLAYNTSKAALNAVVVAFAKELAGTSIKVNAADPGHTATDLNQHRGRRMVAEGAAIVVRLAMLPQDGPTGGYFSDAGTLPW